MNFTPILSSIEADEKTAEAIGAKIVYYVQVAETSLKDGATKLAAVKAALLAFLTDYYPAIASQFGTLWTEVSAFISGLVALYNAVGIFAKLV